MHPFFLLTPLWLIGLVEMSGNASRRLAVLATVLVAVTLIVVPIRFCNLLYAMNRNCLHCRIAIPYEGLATALEARGFKAGTIIAADRHDAGNLRRFFPEARIVEDQSGQLTRRLSVQRISQRRSPWCGMKVRINGYPRRPRANSPGSRATFGLHPNASTFHGSPSLLIG